MLLANAERVACLRAVLGDLPPVGGPTPRPPLSRRAMRRVCTWLRKTRMARTKWGKPRWRHVIVRGTPPHQRRNWYSERRLPGAPISHAPKSGGVLPLNKPKTTNQRRKTDSHTQDQSKPKTEAARAMGWHKA